MRIRIHSPALEALERQLCDESGLGMLGLVF